MSALEPLLHPVVISQVMVNFASQLGVDKETCLLGTDISESQLLDGDTLITRAQEMRLLQNVFAEAVGRSRSATTRVFP